MRYGVQLPLVSRVLFGVLMLIGAIIAPISAGNYAVTEYETVTESIQSAFPDYTAYSTRVQTISPEVQKKLESQLGSRWPITQAEWKDIYRQSKRIGSVIVMDEIGKHYPITFCVAVSEANEVVGVSVLIYREPVGADIRKKRFMKQFVGKTVRDVKQLSQSTSVITGSTLSSWAAITVAKKALLLNELTVR
jgi:thiamine biosynthesis lipoprotein